MNGRFFLPVAVPDRQNDQRGIGEAMTLIFDTNKDEIPPLTTIEDVRDELEAMVVISRDYTRDDKQARMSMVQSMKQFGPDLMGMHFSLEEMATDPDSTMDPDVVGVIKDVAVKLKEIHDNLEAVDERSRHRQERILAEDELVDLKETLTPFLGKGIKAKPMDRSGTPEEEELEEVQLPD